MKFGKDFYAITIVSAIGIALIFALSWQTDPNLKGLPFVPSWVYNWTDSYRNGTIRTAIPFIVLSSVIGVWFFIKRASLIEFISAWFILICVVVLAEFGQYFIPTRDVDFRDIFWGAVGGALGLAVSYIGLLFIRLIR